VVKEKLCILMKSIYACSVVLDYDRRDLKICDGVLGYKVLFNM